MCLQPKKENGNANFKTILSSKINSTKHEINEKKIEMLDFDKNKKLLVDYYRWIDSTLK